MSSRPLPYRERLDNGLRVLVEPTPGHGRGLVAVALTVAAGSDDDPAGRHGMAHLVEHLMFPRGGAAGPDAEEGHAARVASAGGVCNAETHRDRTVFHTVAPAPLLDDALGWEARRLQEFTPSATALRTETEVIAEEIRGTSTAGRLWSSVLAALHPGARDSYGTPGELTGTTVAEAVGFFRRHYRPSAMVVSVVGEAAPERVAARVRKAFGGLAPDARTPPTRPPDRGAAAAPHAGPGRSAVTEPLPWPGEAVAVGHLSPPPARDLPAHLAQVVLTEVLGRGRLPALVRHDPRLTSARVSCGLYGQWPGATAPEPVLAVLGRAPGIRAEDAAKAWTTALRELAHRPPEAAELRRAVNTLLLAWHRGADSLTARAVAHGHHALLLPGGGAAALPDELRRTTPVEVSAAARALLAGPRSLTVLGG
ncbi:pitrilysin family protein [Kitasatospora sp. NPDC056731]|uniref:M16 family metallopeptidase n=1 Tax=Kitasatospora sp. NPDC056731 TaxID=3155422 RepID=UPI00343D2155